jgi:hypothetical protein
VLALPALFGQRGPFLAAAETFAPAAECLLFRAVRSGMGNPPAMIRPYLAAIVPANLASFRIGELARLAGVI